MSDTAYLGNQNLKKIGVPISFTEDQILEYKKCSEDPVYFIDNYCYIVTLDHGIQPFKLYDCQKKKINLIHDNRKVILMEGRQQGKCLKSSSFINIRNKATGELKRVSIESFHEMCKPKM